MQLINQTQNSLVASRLRIARNFIERLVGLLATRTFSIGDALLIPKCNGIHTFGMAFAIDVLFLDKAMKVLRAEKNVGPNRAGPVVMKAASVVELPAGAIHLMGIREGDTFTLYDQATFSEMPVF